VGWLEPAVEKSNCGGRDRIAGLGLGRAVSLEEEALAARFGKTWEEYAAQTPRWLGIKPPGTGH